MSLDKFKAVSLKDKHREQMLAAESTQEENVEPKSKPKKAKTKKGKGR